MSNKQMKNLKGGYVHEHSTSCTCNGDPNGGIIICGYTGWAGFINCTNMAYTYCVSQGFQSASCENIS